MTVSRGERRLGVAGPRGALALAAVAAVWLLPAAARGAVLYDQTDNAGTPASSGSNVGLSNDFGGPGNDQTADDFTVPAGQTWTPSEIDVSGAYSGAPPQQVNAYFYADGGDKPGTQLFAQPAIPASGGPNYLVPLTGAPALGPGHYWVSTQQVGASGPSTYWSWTSRTTQSGDPAMYMSSGSSCLPANSWHPRATCFSGTNPDQVFRLLGTASSSSITLGGVKRNRHRGTATLSVSVPGPGTLTLTGKGLVAQRPARVATESLAVSAAGTVKLTVKANGKRRKKLLHKGKAKVHPTITYTAAAAPPIVVQKTIVLRKKLG